jgi:RNA polymerase sigma-70 factor, ECF subfamily
VQDVFLRLWKRRPVLGDRPGAAHSVPAIRWMLFRAVRNRVIDEVRGRRRARVAERYLEMAVEQPATPVQIVDAVLLGRATERAIRALPARRRTVFTLAHVHGLSHAEVGETLGIAQQTVANHMSLALADLRAALTPYLTPAA